MRPRRQPAQVIGHTAGLELLGLQALERRELLS